MAHWEYTETELWRHGQKDISLYHVFGLTNDGENIWVFAEARTGRGRDANEAHAIHMRRSLDGGRRFEESKVLLPVENGRCWTNPVPVYDSISRRLFLFYSENLDNRRTENFVITSDDQGEHWSPARRINDVLESGKEAPPFHLAGPGHGIQLRHGPWAGRLIVPFWHRMHGTEKEAHERGYCLSALISDDHGASWYQTERLGRNCMGNESRIVETQGELLRIIRPGDNEPARYASHSLDGGRSWTEPVLMKMGQANNCDAGAIGVQDKGPYEDMVLISRISALRERRDMEIQISLDGGSSFPTRMALPPGSAMPGYSDLCVWNEGEAVIGLVHCRSDHVLFSRISVQALTNGEYDGVRRNVWLS